MKQVVKNLINLVNNHKLFSVALTAAAVAAYLLLDSGAAVVLMLCMLGIRFFAALWKRVEREEGRFMWRIFFAAAIVFLHGPVVAMIAELVTNGFWHDILTNVCQGIGWTAFGLLGVLALMLIAVGSYNGWRALTRWAK